MEKKNIFITGGTSGIGLSLAEEYLKDGHHVGICGRDLSKIPERMKDEYPFMHLFELDVTDRQKVLDTINTFAIDNKLDLVIANAGIGDLDNKDLPNFNTINKILDVNIFGVINVFEAALQIMLRNRNGHLVAISSVAGENGLPHVGAYSASKAAVTTFCESLAIDMKKYGISITAILPGFIDTPLTEKNSHPMPFLMNAGSAAELIKKAIYKRKVRYVFPFRMKIVITFLRILPRSFYRTLMKVIYS